ncbi:hypothetical protein SAMN05444487_11451 [Marininema mesophilum]|uniref:Copper resistance protein D n=1 Tax=Marininema mesophilum TaxID=1048340 RepID=A0A1H3ATA9_9BACL|nr:hypothetical protein [Marininema mesophilum]SDX32927.1 hypothetical protein SAMN05444487_11451 [Marininema mesophilum]
MQMDYSIALFIHVLSMASWFGGLAVMVIWLRKSTRLNEEGLSMKKSMESIHNLNVRMMIPVAVLGALAGFYMYLSPMWSSNMPLWLTIKERGISIFILLYIIAFPIYGGKLSKRAQAESGQAAETAVKRYIMLLNISVLVLLFTIFIVTIKL